MHTTKARPAVDTPAGSSYANPKRPYVAGAEERIVEVIVDPAVDPKLWPWSRFWLDEALYAQVKASLSKWRSGIHGETDVLTPSTDAARSMPGPDIGGFRMPDSLFTVNTLISCT